MKTLNLKKLKMETRSIYNFRDQNAIRKDDTGTTTTTVTGTSDTTNTTITVTTSTHRNLAA